MVSSRLKLSITNVISCMQCKRHIYTACFPAAEKRVRRRVVLWSTADVHVFLPSFESEGGNDIEPLLQSVSESVAFLGGRAGIRHHLLMPSSMHFYNGWRERQKATFELRVAAASVCLRITRFEGWLSASRCSVGSQPRH